MNVRRALFAALAVVATISATPRGLPPAAAADDDLVVEGPHVVVRSSFHRRATVEACRDVLEAAIPIYEKSLPFRAPAGSKLSLRLCRDADEYRDVVKTLNLDAFATNLAVTSWNPLTSIVVLQPRTDDAYLAAVGDLPEMTRHLICHEGVHQWLRLAKAQNADIWPDWWGEGTAEWIAERCLVAARSSDAPISVDDARFRVAFARAHDVAVPLRLLLHADASLFEPRNVVYPAARDFVRFLGADPAKFAALAARLRDLPEPAAGVRGERMVALARAFEGAVEAVYGPLPALEQRLAKAPRDAHWFQAGRSFERVGDEIIGSSFPDANAYLLAVTPAPGVAFDVTGDVWYGGGKGAQIDLVLGYERLDDPRYLKIALGRAGYATRLVYAFGNWQTRYKKNVDVPVARLPEGTWLPVRVHVEADRIEVRVGGEPVFESDVPPGFDVLHGHWGFGAYDSWGRFRRFEAKAARAK